MPLTETSQNRLLPLKKIIAANFEQENWLELGAITNSLDVVRGHDRLLRSLAWGDPDYPGNVLFVLISILENNENNLGLVEQYISSKFNAGGKNVSSAEAPGRRIYFTPSVFSAPTVEPDRSLVSVMMPFSTDFRPVYDSIGEACRSNFLTCSRVDDVWEHSTVIQDIFSLIFRSYIVVCDFTGRNPNVFYETGIAHALGKHVVPITQYSDDVPFDLSYRRILVTRRVRRQRFELVI
jgi:AbiJ N-terminal domain 5